MISNKLFYKYQSLEEKKDDNGKNRNYTIENLSKNQLYFSDPTTFNDPFDSKVYFDKEGKEEDWINWLMKNMNYDRIEAIEIISKFFERKGDLIYPRANTESRKQIEIAQHGDMKRKGLSRVCCFSEKCESILMWSHYADYHRGICLRFRYKEDSSGKYLLLSTTQTIKAAGMYSDKECCSPFYKTSIAVYHGTFSEIIYVPTISLVKMFDTLSSIIEQIEQRFLNKLSIWKYEYEHRMLIPEVGLENGVINYNKEDLEGVIFGLKINQEDARRVYETINENYI